MCLFTSIVTVTVEFSLYMMDLMIKINHEQHDKVTGAVDFRGRRPSKDGIASRESRLSQHTCFRASKDVDIPAKQRFHSYISLKFSRDAKAETFSRQKEIFLVQVVLSL